MVLDMLISKVDGAQVVTALPLPIPSDTLFPNRQEDAAYKSWKHEARLSLNYKYMGMDRDKPRPRLDGIRARAVPATVRIPPNASAAWQAMARISIPTRSKGPLACRPASIREPINGPSRSG